jgi:transposase-like protein
MKCLNCSGKMEYKSNLKFNQYELSGWKCKNCGETYFNPEQAEKILLINKLKKQIIKAKLGRIRSNLIIRLPKDIEEVLGLKKGKEVSLELDENKLIIKP